MIKCSLNGPGICLNCKREMKTILKYEFKDDEEVENKLLLCDECSNAVANLYCGIVEDGNTRIYYNNQIYSTGGK